MLASVVTGGLDSDKRRLERRLSRLQMFLQFGFGIFHRGAFVRDFLEQLLVERLDERSGRVDAGVEIDGG